jgi:peptidoglycan/xylan/chitin deacetylase (PgdA/CDA1 family)
MLLALAAAMLAFVAVMAYAVRGRSSALLVPSVWRGPSGRKALALTFDDGPSESTPCLLDVLASHNVRATFFLCGANVRRLPEIVRRVRDAGHEIGNHGFAHPHYHLKSPAFIQADVRQGQETITEVTGVSPRWFRPPYGVRWFGLRPVCRELGLVGVQWSVIGNDWKLCSPDIVDRIAGRAGTGAIVCLHDGRALEINPDIRSTIEAVSELIPLLRSRGFEFDTVSGLLGRFPPGRERSAA